MNHKDILDTALDLGLSGAAILPVGDVVTDPAFRDACAANRCGMYGKCWTCPPDVGDIHELIGILRQYRWALLYQNIGLLEDSYDIEGMHEAGSHHVKMGRALLKALVPSLGENVLHLSAGGCRFCSRCAKLDGLPCRAPEEALSSLEAYGVDVYQTVNNTSLKYVNGQNTVTYFGMILF